MSKPSPFTVIQSKQQTDLAGEMSEKIKEIIYSYEAQVPLALAIGVLRIVEKEIMEAA